MFVGNLPVSVNEKILSKAVEKVVGRGTMTSLRLPVDDSGKARGFAFVSFVNEEAKALAISKLKGFQLMGRALRTDDANSAKAAGNSLPSSSFPTPPQFAGKGDVGTTNEQRNGEVRPAKASKVARPIDEDESLEDIMGYGVDIDVGQDADRGRETSSGGPKAWKRRETTVNAYQASKPVVATVYMGNLAYKVDEMILKEAVERVTSVGAVVNCRIATDIETGRKKGFGYVDFWREEDADKVLEEMSGMSLMGRPLKVDDATR